MDKKEKYLLISPDWELLDKEINNILTFWKKSLGNCKTQFIVWEQDKASEKKLATNLQTQDFFAEKILIVDINKLQIYGLNKQKAFLNSLLKNDRYLVLTAKKKFKNELEKIFLQENFKIKIVTKFTQAKKRKIVIEKLHAAKISFGDLTLNYLLTNLSSRYLTLEKELEKIEIFFWEKTPAYLNVDLAKKIINPNPETNIFIMIEALLKNDQKEFWNNYQKVNPPISLVHLLATFSTYLYQMKKIKVLMKKQLTFLEIVAKMARAPFLVSSLMRIAKNSDNFFLDKLIKKIKEMEYNSKTSELKEEALLTQFFMV